MPATAARAASLLPLVAGFALVASWWLSLIIVFESPAVDFTPPELVVLGGGLLGLATRPWRWLERRDLPILVLVAAYVAWFPVAALLRGTSDDLKTAAAFVVFAGAAAAIAYAAGRLRPALTARVLVGVVLAALVVSFAAAVLERLTYPLPGQPDPLEGLWTFFRPRVGLDDPRLGPIDPPPLHSTTGEPGVVRATAFFVQTNYLAFFCVLAAPLAVVLLVSSLRNRRRVPALVGAVLTAAAIVTAYWTYARVGIIAVGLVILAALLVEWLATGGPRRWRPSTAALRPSAAVLVFAIVVMAGSLLSDGVGLSRLGGTTLGESPPMDGPGAPGGQSAETAARSGQIRLELQRTALEMVVEDARSVALGPGLAAFETAVHDPRSPRHLPEARFIRDPNSLWLTVALAGGVTGVLLLAVLLLALTWRLMRTMGRPADPWIAVVILWLAAWLPVWAAVQLLGTNPFNTSESIIFGTLAGAIGGLTIHVLGSPAPLRSAASRKLDEA